MAKPQEKADEKNEQKPQPRAANADLILAAAARLFRSKGYGAATVRDIARAAGVLPGTLHYWFPNKERILFSMAEAAVLGVTARVREAIAGSHDPVRRLRLALDAYVMELLRGGDAMVVLLYEFRSLSGGHRAAIAALRNRFDRIWDGLVHQAVGAGSLRPEIDVRLVRLFGLGAANWVLQWYTPKGDYTPEEIAEKYARFFAGSIFPGAPPPGWQPEPEEPSAPNSPG